MTEGSKGGTILHMLCYYNSEMQKDAQEAFNEVPAQVVINAMTHYGREEFDSVIDWRIY